MQITMTDTRILSIPELKKWLSATESFHFETHTLRETYVWMDAVLRGYRYHRLRRGAKGVVRRYLEKMTSYSTGHVSHLIDRWSEEGRLTVHPSDRHIFPRVYTHQDIVLLAEVDRIHDRLSGPATRVILQREFRVFHKTPFERLSHISASHIYNLRSTEIYHTHFGPIHHTKGSGCTLGERRIPRPNGAPGFIRVDTVHQGDNARKGEGIYHINLVDEVTQWEIVICVASLSEMDVLPAIEIALSAFPFVIKEFHSDNGSEFINRKVAATLTELKAILSKSRPRRHNDNALVEGKNAWIIRKHHGYGFIAKTHVTLVRRWQEKWLNPYLNFHRPCGYATVTYKENGKEVRRYSPDNYQTPYERFKGVENPEQYLKPGLTLAKLDKIGYARSDTEHAKAMQEGKLVLAEKLSRQGQIQYLPTT